MKSKNLMALAILALLLAGTVGAQADSSTTAPVSPTAVVKAKAPKKAKAKKVQSIALSVTDEGFVPANIKVKKGESYNLVITRKTDQTCARQIVIPDYNVSQNLPLNVPVTIALVPKAAGEINYSCSMGMIHGVLSVE
jgi:plastocyanin domain-containing protein